MTSTFRYTHREFQHSGELHTCLQTIKCCPVCAGGVVPARLHVLGALRARGAVGAPAPGAPRLPLSSGAPCRPTGARGLGARAAQRGTAALQVGLHRPQQHGGHHQWALPSYLTRILIIRPTPVSNSITVSRYCQQRARRDGGLPPATGLDGPTGRDGESHHSRGYKHPFLLFA